MESKEFLGEAGLAEVWRLVRRRLAMVAADTAEITVTVKTSAGAPVVGAVVTRRI
jgi:hypothetical protein